MSLLQLGRDVEDRTLSGQVNEGPTKLARELSRSENSVTSLANRFGLRSLTRIFTWKQERIDRYRHRRFVPKFKSPH